MANATAKPNRELARALTRSKSALMLFLSQGVLEVVRSRILVRIGNHLDEASSDRVFEVMTRTQTGATAIPLRFAK